LFLGLLQRWQVQARQGSLGRTTRVCGLARLTDESMGG